MDKRDARVRAREKISVPLLILMAVTAIMLTTSAQAADLRIPRLHAVAPPASVPLITRPVTAALKKPKPASQPFSDRFHGEPIQSPAGLP